MIRRPISLAAAVALGMLPSCKNTGGYTLKFSAGYQGVSIGVEIERPVQPPEEPEPPLPVEGKEPVPAP